MLDVPAGRPVWSRTWAAVQTADRFVRIHYLSFSAMWPLLGATTVHQQLRPSELAALLAVTLGFHVYAMLFNDVIDLPIDRTQPKRQRDPLVRGTIAPWQAMAIALLQPAATVPLTMWLGGSLRAHAVLGVGFALMAVYNLWGKRCPFPPLTDAVQGLAWGSLAVYGALAVGAEPNAMTWLVAAYVAVFTLIVNGVHGPLRDLENDFARGARTTAIFLGARPSRGSDPLVPSAVAIFDALARAALVAVLTVLLVRNDFGYGPVAVAVTALVVAAICAFLTKLHARVVHPRGREWEAAFRLDVFLLTMALPVAFVGYASAEVVTVLVLLNAIAIALFSSTPAVARWAWRAVTSPARPLQGKSLATGIPRTD